MINYCEPNEANLVLLVLCTTGRLVSEHDQASPGGRVLSLIREQGGELVKLAEQSGGSAEATTSEC